MIKDLWYKNAIFYCVHVGAFMDANDKFGTLGDFVDFTHEARNNHARC